MASFLLSSNSKSCDLSSIILIATATTYNGTAAISLKNGPIKGVPISIILIGTSVMNLWIDPSKTEGHFGNTPIYGVQSGIR